MASEPITLSTADRVLWVLRQRRWDLQDLHQAIGVPRKSFYRYMNGLSPWPAAVVGAMATKLGCTADFLMGLTDHVELKDEATGLYLEVPFSKSLALAV